MREEFLNIFLFRILELRWSAWHIAKDYFLFSQIERKEEREERERKKERREKVRKEEGREGEKRDFRGDIWERRAAFIFEEWPERAT